METTYQTQRLIIRILNSNWNQQVYRFLSDNRDIFDPFEPVKPIDYYSKSFQKILLTQEYRYFKERSSFRFYIFSKDNPQKIIGSVSFSDIQASPFHSCILGYKFDENFQGRGYAFESINTCIPILLNNIALHRITAYIMPSNTPSIKLIKKLNFIYEGTSPHLVNINGRWEDHQKYSFINYDFE